MRWFLNVNGQNSGPYDDAAVVQMIQAGQLTAAWICKEGGNDWVALGAHPPFAQALLALQGAPGVPQTPPAPQAPMTPGVQPPMPGQQVPGQQVPGQQVPGQQPSQQWTPQTAPIPGPQVGAPNMAAGPEAAPFQDGGNEKDSLGKLFGRIPKLFTSPSAYWDEVGKLKGGFAELLLPNVLLLVGASALFSFLGALIGFRHILAMAPGSMILGLAIAFILQIGVGVGIWLFMALFIDAFAGTFGAQKDGNAARKLALGALTPMWLAGILSIIPFRSVGMILGLAGFGYGCYLLFAGLPKLNATPAPKATGYTAAVMGLMIVISFGLGLLAACPTGCAVGCAARNAFRKARIRRMIHRKLRGRSALDKAHHLGSKPVATHRALGYTAVTTGLAMRVAPPAP